MDQQTQIKIYSALSYISLAQVGLVGLQDRVKNGHPISEYELSGFDQTLEHAKDLIESLQ